MGLVLNVVLPSDRSSGLLPASVERMRVRRHGSGFALSGS